MGSSPWHTEFNLHNALYKVVASTRARFDEIATSLFGNTCRMSQNIKLLVLGIMNGKNKVRRPHTHTQCGWRQCQLSWATLQGAAKKTYHDKNLIFSQTNRKFKTKFSTLIRNIYVHISIKYYWKISMNRTMRFIWNESFKFAIYQLKSSVKQCFKQAGFIIYLPSTIFKIYYVIVYVISDYSVRTVVHYMVMISFSNMTPHQL